MAMYRIIVRAKKDKKAVEHVVETYYRNGYEVVSLQGARSVEEIIGGVESIATRERYNIVLLGRRYSEHADAIERETGRNTVVVVLDKVAVRNTRPEHLYSAIEEAKARQRLSVYWRGRYLYSRGGPMVEIPVSPRGDIFVFMHRHRVIGGLGIGDYLVYRVEENHYVLSGPRVAGSFSVPEKYREIMYSGEPAARVSLESLVADNEYEIYRWEYGPVEAFMESLGDPELVLVPWSGGKDSTTLLYIATRIYGAERVVAVTAEMDYDFPDTRLFIEEVADKLGIQLVTVPVNLKPHIPSRGLPMANDRWCTELKVEALERKYRELCGDRDCLVLVGDRDVESSARSKRPLIRRTATGYLQATPLRQWSTLTLQLYMLAEKIPVNPLYEEGFYRIGCYICPFLRSLELLIMTRSERFRVLWRDEYFYSFLRSKGYDKPEETRGSGRLKGNPVVEHYKG